MKNGIIYLVSFICFSAQSIFAEPHTLGLSAPLSGDGAGWGNDVKNVLLFANEKIADGEYSFIFEDDLCNPKNALSVARKLTSINKIKEVFVVCGQATISSAKTYNESNVTVMSPLATPSRISKLGVFRTSLSDKFAAEKLAKFISSKHERIYAFTELNDYSVSFLNDFKESANSLNLKVSNQEYLPQQQDFRTQLVRLKKDGAKALFLNTQTEGALANLVKQLHEIDYSPDLYGAYLPGSAGFMKIAGQFAEGLTFVDYPGAIELLTKEGQSLYKEFLNRFGPIHGWSFAFPATYEAFRSIHLGIQSNKPIKEFLKTTTFNGIFGKYTFDDNGDIVGPHHVLRVIQNGKAVLLNNLDSKNR